MISSIIQVLFFIKIQLNMSEQEKKINDLLQTETKSKKFRNIWSFLWLPSRLDLKPLDYAIWGISENKTNATSHPNIGSLKTATEEECNKMSEEFILKACKSFQRHVDIIIEKNVGHIKQIYCFVSIF